MTTVIFQGGGCVIGGKLLQPAMDTAPVHTQPLCHLGHGSALIDEQQGQCSPKKSSIPRLIQRLLQCPALRCSPIPSFHRPHSFTPGQPSI